MLNSVEPEIKTHNMAGSSHRNGVSAARLKSTTNWNGELVSTDDYGFRVLATGFRTANGTTLHIPRYETYFWSSSAFNSTNVKIRYFANSINAVYSTANTRTFGFPVRCIRDK
jgi:uncharacterized protein (TIGR02145 family)